MKTLLLTLTFMIFFNSQSHGISNCAHKLDFTSTLLSYLDRLVEQRIIDVTELSSFAKRLAEGKLPNPISEERATIDSNALIHREELELHFQKGVDLENLLTWVKGVTTEKRRIVHARSEAKTETRISKEIIFRPIPGGEVRVTLSWDAPTTDKILPFEIMSSPVTQEQWVRIMGRNPSFHNLNTGETVTTPDGKSVSLQPDHPVEGITWWSALVFANLLSKKHGYKPAYDLSEIPFAMPMTYEEGNLQSIRTDHAILYNLSQESRTAEGYRLPRIAELTFIAQNSKTANGENIFQADLLEKIKYFWLAENSKSMSHPVEMLLPVYVFGQRLYDITGNVSLWTSDHFERWATNNFKITYDPYFNTPAAGIAPERIGKLDANDRNPTVGLRLVRTLKP